MNKYQNYYLTLPDGTLKHINPLSGTEVWTVPTRAYRPFLNRNPVPAKPLLGNDKESYCDFCQTEYFRTPPEKSRLVINSDGSYHQINRLNPDLLQASYAFFRRISNLFEIVTFDYWVQNHAFQLTPAQKQWKDNYIGNPRGQEHVLDLIDTKLKLSGSLPEKIQSMSTEEKLLISNSFFGGSHEVIPAGRHFRAGARWDNELFSSGEMTPEEHYHYVRFTIDAMVDILENNPFVRYISIFQNWLQPAGASFDHLHKQLVGMDEWGNSIRKELEIVEKNPNVYNESIVNFSAKNNLLLAENDNAIVLSEIGHPVPTLGIYSKSKNSRPHEHTEKEMRDLSDLVHACHAAMGNQIPCSEEWYYTPKDSPQIMPWHLLIKWRTVNPAGFEGGTHIFINPVSPLQLRNQMVTRLFELRGNNKIKNIRIADECERKPNPLLYLQK